jgi:hypothetical protein
VPQFDGFRHAGRYSALRVVAVTVEGNGIVRFARLKVTSAAPRPALVPVESGSSPRITHRETELLAVYLETGKLYTAARRLGLPEATAKNRLRRLYQRNGLQSIAQAVWKFRHEIERYWLARRAPFAPGRPHTGADVEVDR